MINIRYICQMCMSDMHEHRVVMYRELERFSSLIDHDHFFKYNSGYRQEAIFTPSLYITTHAYLTCTSDIYIGYLS